MRFWKFILVSLAIFTTTTRARAESERGAFHIEGHVLGVSLAVPSQGVGAAYPLEISAGYHVSGRHDGFVVGIVQRFDLGFTGPSTGASAARLGWDFSIPAGKMEFTIAPYVQGGAVYGFSGGASAGGLVGTGIEGRLFPFPVVKAINGKMPVRTKRVEVRADHIEIHEKVQFEANKAVIEPVSFALLDEIADVLRRSPQIKRVQVEGHASSEGDAEVNRTLSEARAKAVREHLVAKGGIAEDRLTSKGFGSSKPLSNEDSEAGREKNRRVELNIVEQDATIEKLVEHPARGGAEGFFVVVKPIEVDLAIVPQVPVVPVLSLQAGIGWAF